MTTDKTPRGDRNSRTPGTATGTALALLLAVSATSPACLLAVWLAPHPLRPEIAWTSAGCALLLCAAVTFAAHQRLTARRLRVELAERDATAAARRAAAERFADVTVAEVVHRLRGGASAESALAAVGRVEDDVHRRVLGTLATEVHRGESGRAAAMAACANAAGRVQALTTSMAADLREMEHRHSDPDVLGDLLHLDHRTAQTGRLADSIAVLTGARSGRRWAKPIRMESILRGAMGRIQGYQRVRPHSTSTVAVAGHAAEGVMHALAEIMDNAANFSPPTSEVHVYVEEVSAGVVVTVEDGGLVMGEVALQRAEQAVRPRSARDLDALPGTRLGLSVVGRLAYKHGLTVSFRPSAHGGTGVLLRIPQELVTDAAPRATGDTLGRGLPHPAAQVRASASAGGADAVSSSAGGSDAVSSGRRAGDGGPASERDAPEAAGGTGRAGAEDVRRDTDAPHDPRLPHGGGGAGHDEAGPGSHPGPTVRSGKAATGEHALAPEEGSGHRRRPGPTAESADSGEGTPVPSAGASDAARGASDAARHDAAPDGVEQPPPVEYGESGLPRRRRGRTLATALRAAETTAGGRTRRTRSAAESGSRLGAFRRAVRIDAGARGEASGSGAGTAPGDTPPRAPDTDAPSTSSPTTSPTRPEDDAQ